ncbi:hypothetical protein CLAIMM_11186 [Cladophialophora immunda]|nr:hypothetical protein CLAIMM_11186 [Cladophialophora immunda]
MAAQEEIINTGIGWRKVSPAKDSQNAGSFTEVPVIDLSDMCHPDINVRRVVAKKIYDVCVTAGFFYISNHGVPQEDIDMCFRETARFFHELPFEEKIKLDITNNKEFYGYKKIDFDETIVGGAKLLEGYNIGYEPGCDPSPTHSPNNNGDNFWPAEEKLPGWRGAMEKYMGQMLSLSRSLLRLFALSLDLDEDFFEALCTQPGTIMTLNHYPGKLQKPDIRSSIAPHTDYELFTILLQDDNKSLEVVSKNGTWIPVDPIPGTFVVNIGDAMSVWTNDLFVSTLHRAANREARTRYSIPFFFGANYDAVMETLPSCISDECPKKYKAMTNGEYVRMRLAGVYPKAEMPVTYETIEVAPQFQVAPAPITV